MLENLSYLIVSPDLDSRTKLREILKTFIYKGKIDHERTLRNLPEKFTNESNYKRYSALFLASNFGHEVLTTFIQEAKAKAGEDLPPVIIFINSRELDKSSNVASLYLDGFDGFISEPYSSEELLKLIETIQNRRKQANLELKTKRAAGFLAADAMSHIDTMALQISEGEAPDGYEMRQLKNVSKGLAKIAETNLELYTEVLTSTFESATPAVKKEIPGQISKKAKRVMHPGATVKELMAARNLTTERLLPRLRIEPADFELLLNEQKPLNESIARELSRTLGMTATEWMRLQREYDAKQSKKAGVVQK